MQEVADNIHDRFGVVVAILLAGPHPEVNGDLTVRRYSIYWHPFSIADLLHCSIHSGTTKGILPKKWPDWAGSNFKDIERGMLQFTGNCFSVFIFIICLCELY